MKFLVSVWQCDFKKTTKLWKVRAISYKCEILYIFKPETFIHETSDHGNLDKTKQKQQVAIITVFRAILRVVIWPSPWYKWMQKSAVQWVKAIFLLRKRLLVYARQLKTRFKIQRFLGCFFPPTFYFSTQTFWNQKKWIHTTIDFSEKADNSHTWYLSVL